MGNRSKWLAWFTWAFLSAGAFLGPASWGAQHAIVFSLAGLILLAGRGPAIRTGWACTAGILFLLPWLVFLPSSYFSSPPWSEGLARLGIESSSQVIQGEMAAEMGAVFVLFLGVGLWMTAKRYPREAMKSLALAFSLGVSVYAVLSWILKDHLTSVRGGDHFGFFPNRNHSATYLAMGVFSSIGSLVQEAREKRVVPAALAGLSLVVILVALIFWSESRAGILLVLTGVGGYALLAGPSILGRNTLGALGLVLLLGGGLFALGDSRVKERITSTVSFEGGGVPTKDFRIPTWRDTLTMIRAAPVSGVGAGQFRFVFPQYKHYTATEQHAVSYHPESDWLWVAAESGIPAALVLGGLVVSAAVHSIRRLRIGRSRALRAGCLVAALIVPFHGILDVPGHRIILMWSACWLFALSLPPREREGEGVAGKKATLFWKLAGLASLVAGLHLVSGTWFDGRVPAIVSADDALRRAEVLLELDDQRRAEAHARGDAEYDPSPQDDPLEQAYVLLGRAADRTPLDTRLHADRAVIGLQFDDRDQEIERLFAVEKILNPKSINVLIRQGRLWRGVDPAKTVARLREAEDLGMKIDGELGLGGRLATETRNKIREIIPEPGASNEPPAAGRK